MRLFFYPLILVTICLYLIFQNYTPGTYLTGWDTLHPEFDFALNLKRVIFGVFRQEQGLGAVAGHSQMSDLPRIVFLYISSFILPIDFLRYFYFFTTLILGPLGVYFFLEKVVFKGHESTKKEISAFLGGLFYLLNLGTLQHFYVPFEMFAALYGFLPWLFLFASKFLLEEDKHKQSLPLGKKNLFLFCLFSLLATPMAYAATLAYVYFASFIIYLITLYLSGQKSYLKLSKLIILLFVIFAINSYWLLPNLYFIKNHSTDVSTSKINEDFSEKAFAYDSKYANLENVSILRSFLFDWQEYRSQKPEYLLNEWRNYLQKPFIVVLGATFFGIIVFGIFISIITKDKFGLIFLPVFSFTFIFLIHGQPPLNLLFDFIRDKTSLLSEGLRFPWTKFSIFVMFFYAIYFSKSIFIFINLFKKTKTTALTIGFLVSLSLIIWMLPAFSGQLISPSMRIDIPSDYFKTFEYFKKQPEDKRIAVFPASSFRGWEYYNWGFQGAGFIWFGLKQPVLVRDFDRWNPKNENYYWEISYAVYSKNLSILEEVLQKYQVSYLLIDESSTSPSFPKSVYTDELESMLAESSKISLDQSFGKVKLYKVKLAAPLNNFVFLKTLPSIGPNFKWTNLDKAYLENGDYVNSETGSLYYPFRSLFTGRDQADIEFSMEDKGDHFVFKKVLPVGLEDYHLQIPAIADKDLQWVDPKDLSKIKNVTKDVYFDGKTVEISVPKIGGLYSAEIDPGGKQEFLLQNLPHSIGYLVMVESNNLLGKPSNFWIENLNSRRADLETNLPKGKAISYFIQPPMEKDGLGYMLHSDDYIIGSETAKNELGKIKVYPIPFDFLSGLVLKKEDVNKNENLSSISVTHPNPSYYTVSLPANLANQTLILSQSFENGWRAYEGIPLFSRELKHILVNSWENGWVLDNSLVGKQIVLIFLPQYLEFVGGGLGLIWIVLVLIAFRRHH